MGTSCEGADGASGLQTSTEYVVIDETVAPGSELELVDAFGSIIERLLQRERQPGFRRGPLDARRP